MAKKSRVDWLKTAQRYLEEGEGGSVGRVTEYSPDGSPSGFEECSLERAREAREGHFVLVDSEGDVISDCVLDGSGERFTPRRAVKARLGDSGEAIVQREIARNMSDMREQWGGISVELRTMLKQERDRADRMQKELEEAKERIAELIAAQGDDHSEWVELAQSALSVLTGKATKEALGRIAQRLVANGAVKPEEAQKLVGAVNEAIAQEDLGSNALKLITGGANAKS